MFRDPRPSNKPRAGAGWMVLNRLGAANKLKAGAGCMVLNRLVELVLGLGVPSVANKLLVVVV